MDYIAQPKDYWIAPTAIAITLNALGEANRIQGSVASGASILCYIKNNAGQVLLDYNSGHQFRTWPLSLSPTYFNSDTSKYVYAAIPRTTSVGTMAVIVFPSEQLDVYGINSDGTQVGSADYYYIYLNGIISEVQTVDGVRQRTWMQNIDTGSKGSDEALNDPTETDWYIFSKVSQVVTFLKPLIMNPASWFQNLRLGNSNSNLTGVATATTPDDYIDSETLVVTPSYINNKYLSKAHDDTAAGSITFEKDVNVKGLSNMQGDAAVGGNLGVSGWVKSILGYFRSLQSENYTGDGIADTGYRLTSDDGNGASKLTVDKLYVRMKAVFEELQVKRETVTGGNQVFSCAANIINRTDYFDSSNNLLGYTEIKAPWLLKGVPTFLSRSLATLGVFSSKRTIRVELQDASNISYIRCYFLAKEGEEDISNLWEVNDLARCQTFNLNHKERETYISGTTTQAGNVFWWRKVVGVSSTPVEIEGRLYHYFDVSMSDCAANSDLPAAGDNVSQWGNTTNTERMNLRTIEVNGSGAPADKWYRGIYTYDMSKCWWGGNPCKDKISAADGVEFYGPTFKYVQEYGVERVATDRGDWSDITPERDDYSHHGNVRKCYYYDRVSYNGSLWLCTLTEGYHWVINNGTEQNPQWDYIENPSAAQIPNCKRVQNYTTQTPADGATDWLKQVDSGQDAAPTAPNLLLDTASYAEPSLWFHLHGQNTDGFMGRVARFVNPQGTSDPAGDSYQRIAEQIIAGEDISLLEPSTWYTLSGYFKGSGQAFIGLLQCGGYIEELHYGDGNEQTGTLTLTADVYCAFALTSEWTRHTLTFKTKATMSDTYNMYASSRLLDLSGNASVCMLKLEVGKQATAYIPNEQDLAGEDAVNVLCTPSALIVNQSLSDPSNLNNLSADPSARAIIQILKGVEPQTITAVTITSREHCTATAGVSGGNGYIQLASVATYTEQGNSYYYDRGYVICSLTYAGGTIDNVKLSFYANLLGTWKETVEADTKAAIAQSNLFDLDPETGQIVESQYLGNFIQSSTQNIATLTAKVNNGKNLLKGVLTGAGWEDEDGNAVSVNNNEFLICSGDNITPPTFALENGKQYTLSCDNNATVLFNGDGVNFSLSGSRYYAVLTAGTTNTLEFRSNVKHPQLEVGSTPTEFEADVTEISSRYKQTADNVRIGVTQGLSNTGIDIVNGKVDVQANDFRVLDEDNTPLMSVSSSGGIKMIETEIEGSLKVNRTYAGGVISTITSIDAYSWGTGFYVYSSNTNTGYTSTATFGSSNVAGNACSLNFSDSDGMNLRIDPTQVRLSEGNSVDVRIHSGGIDVNDGAVSLTGDGIDFDGSYMIMRKDGFEYPYADEWGGTGRHSLRGKRYARIGTNLYLLIYGGLLIGYSTTQPDNSWTEILEIDPNQI